MSTHAALHIQSPDPAAVIDYLQEFLTYTRRPRVVRSVHGATIGELYGQDFIVSNASPTLFAVASEDSGWVIAHYNSLHRLPEVAEEISRRLACLVVVVMAQSVSDAYYVSVHRSGEKLRALEFADGEWRLQEGAPFPFEDRPLGTNTAEADEDPYYRFGRRDVSEFCRQLGLRIWLQETEPGDWTVIQVEPSQQASRTE